MTAPGIAKQKWHDIAAEKQPRAVALRPQFIVGATARLHAGKSPLDAMRDEVTENGQKYLCLGSPVPEPIITGSSGVSRVVDLPSIFKFSYASTAFLTKYQPESPEQFVDLVRKGSFDPTRDMKDEAVLKGKAEETWWFPSSAANAANIEKLREQLYIHQEVSYTHGAVRLDMPPGELKRLGIELHKPTAFDGIMQGWEGDAWWKHSEDPHWGLTKNNTYEAVMRAMTLAHFKKRTLMMPGASPVAEGAKPGHPTAASGGGTKHG